MRLPKPYARLGGTLVYPVTARDEEMTTAMQYPTTELDPEEFHRTNDMSLVAWLKIRGHDVQVVRWERDTCYWFFRNVDRLYEDIDIFHDKAATVEPTQYNRMYQQTKREFYDTKP